LWEKVEREAMPKNGATEKLVEEMLREADEQA
jgi:hypothetical protein